MPAKGFSMPLKKACITFFITEKPVFLDVLMICWRSYFGIKSTG
jgi:hypothetical protein